jgi:hypothetical protein
MPDETTNQTTDNGTVLDQTPTTVTEGQTAEISAPDASPTPTIDYEAKWKASQAEGIRLYQRTQQLENILSNQRQPEPAPRPEPVQEESNAYQQLTDAVLDRDYGKIKHWESTLAQSIKKQIVSEGQEQNARNTRINASSQAIQEAFGDKNPALGHEAMNRYQRMLNDPSYSFVAQDYIPVPTPQGPININPHLMRIAVTEARADLGIRAKSATDKAKSENSFIESGGGSNVKASAPSNKFDENKHLTELQRTTCEKHNWNKEDYWNNMDPKVKAARLKAGKPI